MLFQLKGIEVKMSEIANNIKKIREKISDAAAKSGRSDSEIMLIAATKMNNAENVREAINAGVDAVGENRVQELLGKYEENAYEKAQLHFIGGLQSNKVKYIVGKVALIQSVDSIRLVKEIDKQAKKNNLIQDILIEINIGEEETKGGVLIHELDGLLTATSEFGSVRVRGLMTIPPIKTEKNRQIAYFERMYQLFIDIEAKKYDNISMDYLSMGMTDDYYEAILCGANMVRIGSGIFGARNY